MATWRALAGTQVIGEANAMLRPDRRWFISVDTWVADSFLPLVSAVADDLCQDLYTTVDEDDEAALRNSIAAGFTVLRREHHYLVPTGPDQTRLAAGALPAGMSLVSADAVDEDGLRLLDEALRQDVPGSDGWVNDPQEFREYTFNEWRFDPATYLVAIDDASQAFAGLAGCGTIRASPVLAWLASRPDTAARAWPRYCSPWTFPVAWSTTTQLLAPAVPSGKRYPLAVTAPSVYVHISRNWTWGNGERQRFG